MNGQSTALKPWWGAFSVPQNQSALWRVGPMDLHIRHVRQEWHVAHECVREPLDRTLEMSIQESPPSSNGQLVFSRFAFRETSGDLQLSPVLPDRAVVIRPEAPLYVPAKEEVRLYVSLPLWVRVEAGQPAKYLQEIPIYRPSDTWFGRSMIKGELCYASWTSARLHVEDVPLRPHRAVSPVLIRNDAKDPLFLERLNLTAHYLSLYVTPEGYLWTQGMILEREADGERVQARFEKTAPAAAAGAVPFCGPRVAPDENLFKRAMDAFFS